MPNFTGNPVEGRNKRRSNCPGQVNFALGRVKIEAEWPSGKVKYSLVSLKENVSMIHVHVNDNFLSEVISKLKTARLVNH